MDPAKQTCAVPSCRSKDRRGEVSISFHRFPSAYKNNQLRLDWIAIIRGLKGANDWEPAQSTTICSRHFQESCFSRSEGRRRLREGALPTLNFTEFSLTIKTPTKGTDGSDDTGLIIQLRVEIFADPHVVDFPINDEEHRVCESERQHLGNSIICCPNCDTGILLHFDENGTIEVLDGSNRRLGSNSRKRLFHESSVAQFDDENSPISLAKPYEEYDFHSMDTSSTYIEVTPTSRKRLRKEHNYHESPSKAADLLKATKQELESLKIKYKNLQRKLERHDSAHQKDKLVLREVLDTCQQDSLEKDFPKLLLGLIANEKTALQVRGKTGMVYDEEIKKFCATLHFYSPKAYDFIREYLTLPQPHTISSWMRSSDCGPGYNTDVLGRLTEVRRSDTNNVMTDVVVMIDEMAIRKELRWNPSTHSLLGHIDYGLRDAETLDALELPLASNALVCMIGGFSGGWKVPIGYIFTDKADSNVQKTFVDKAFLLLEEGGFNPHALISDGCTANVSLFHLYGVEEIPGDSADEISFDDIVSSFSNPSNPSKVVHAIYDVCHMIKLWRNLLAQCGEILMNDGRIVNWEYLVKLFRLQDEEKIRAANKLSKNHIEFTNHKMNVRLAVQSISKSNADAIVFCRDKLKLPEFNGSEGTTFFMYLLDKVFDILNSRNPVQKGHKSPLSKGNLAYQTEILRNFCSVVLGMTYAETRHYQATKTRPARVTKTYKILARSARKRPAIGLVISIKSILTVSYNLLYRDISPIKFVMTYRFSQDLLELFFSKIRGRLGRNNNPNVIEFTNTMKACWHQNMLKSCNTGNCVEQMTETYIPAGLLPLKREKVCKVTKLELDEIGDLESIDLSAFPDPNYSFFYKNCLAYIAGNVVRVVGTKLTCETCCEGLLDVEQDALDDRYRKLILVKDRGGLFIPCKSVFKIVEMTDHIFRQLVKETDGKMRIADLDHKIFKLVLSKCIEISIFPHVQSHFVDFDPLMSKSHLHTLIREIVLHFLKIRLFDYGKHFQKNKKISTRHTLNKVTLFKGQ